MQHSLNPRRSILHSYDYAEQPVPANLVINQ